MRRERSTATLAYTRHPPSLPPWVARSTKVASRSGSNTIWVCTKSAPAATLRPSRASWASWSPRNGRAPQPRGAREDGAPPRGEGGGAHDLRTQGQPVAVAAGDVDDGGNALLSGQRDGGKWGHARLAGVVVGQADQVDVRGERGDAVAHPGGVRP